MILVCYPSSYGVMPLPENGYIGRPVVLADNFLWTSSGTLALLCEILGHIAHGFYGLVWPTGTHQQVSQPHRGCPCKPAPFHMRENFFAMGMLLLERQPCSPQQCLFPSLGSSVLFEVLSDSHVYTCSSLEVKVISFICYFIIP